MGSRKIAYMCKLVSLCGRRDWTVRTMRCAKNDQRPAVISNSGPLCTAEALV